MFMVMEGLEGLVLVTWPNTTVTLHKCATTKPLETETHDCEEGENGEEEKNPSL